MNSPQNQPDNRAETSKERYLDRALRLSELQLAQFNTTLTTIERKAILLVTLYIATIAFTLSFIWANQGGGWLPMVAIAFLATGTYIGVFTVYATNVGISGAHPDYLLHEHFGLDGVKMSTDLLKSYKDAINLNQKLVGKKGKRLQISFWLGGAGVLLAFCWVCFHSLLT